MLPALKKLFDWTPSDITAWEKIRAKGWVRFTLWYGLSFSVVIFLVMGVITLITWPQSIENIAGLLFQLAFNAGVCLLGGLVTSLITWRMEESIYQKIMRSRSSR